MGFCLTSKWVNKGLVVYLAVVAVDPEVELGDASGHLVRDLSRQFQGHDGIGASENHRQEKKKDLPGPKTTF